MTTQFEKQIQNQSQTEYMQSNQPQIAGGEAGKRNRIKTHSQSGRSMVEMLGVLAIIAILSIGGIVGYKLAMNYYQADQIANEINLMRNDLKVKYALGNEELLLGDPYDDTPENEHYSGHLSTQYDRYPVDYDCIRKDKAEFYNCRETDSYYIKIANVSKGVCRPLTTLLNGMDGLMYMEINKEVYKEGDLCSSDEANEIYIEFDAEDVNGNYDSNRPEGWCADDEDCPDEKPFCENERCVECTPETSCESNTQHCENNECISCPEGKIWSGTACVDCMTDTDCADTSDTPICNTDEHICVECTTDEDCLAKGTDEPICNTTEGTCEPCPEGESWSNEFKECIVTSCQTNNECNINGKTGYYCFFTSSENCEQQTGFGTCRLVDYDLTRTVTINGTTYYASENTMSWFSACHLCTGKHRADDLKCNNPGETWGSDYMADYSILQCSPEMDMTKQTLGWCYKNGTGAYNNSYYSGEDLSDFINILRTQIFGCNSTVKGVNTSCAYYFWLKNSYDACHAYYVSLATGLVMQDDRISYYDDNLVLCK